MKYILRFSFAVIFCVFTYSSFAQQWQQFGKDTLTNVNWQTLSLNSLNKPYILYRDEFNHGKPTVIRLNGNKWVKVGNAISESGCIKTQIVIGNDDLPIVAYQDSSYTNRKESGVTVKKFNGLTWDSLGTFGLINSVFSLAVDTNNLPVIAFTDRQTFRDSNKVSIKKFNGFAWNYIGAAKFTNVNSSDFSLAVNPVINQPYLLYDNKDGYYQINVQKFNGVNWEIAGQPNICKSKYGAFYLSIAFDGNGIAFIGFQDDNGEGKASVYKLKNNIWKPVGSQYFSPGHTHNNCLAVSKNGKPYMSFNDAAVHDSVTVMSFQQNKWTIIGRQGFTSNINTHALSVGTGGSPYILHREQVAQFVYKAVVERYVSPPKSGISISDSASATAGIRFVAKLSKPGTTVFPNPVKDVVKISGNSIALLRLYDATGKLVSIKKPAGNMISLNTSKLARGSYILLIENSDHTIEHRSIILQ